MQARLKLPRFFRDFDAVQKGIISNRNKLKDQLALRIGLEIAKGLIDWIQGTARFLKDIEPPVVCDPSIPIARPEDEIAGHKTRER